MASLRAVPGAAPSKSSKGKKQSSTSTPAAVSFTSSKTDPLSAANEASTSKSGQSGKPDKSAHEREVQAIDAEIKRLQAAQAEIRSKMNGSDPKANPLVQQRNAKRQELNALREQQAGSKTSRGKVMDQVKTMQERLQAKVKELQASKSKFPYKSANEVDNRIAQLERQVEGGNLKLVDERKTLNEISNLKKSRRTIESFDAQQSAIDADKKALDEQRKLLDDPEAKAASEKYNALKAELDKLNDELDENSKLRNKHYEQVDGLKKQIDEQWSKKREARDAFRSANDAYYQKINEERTKRMERIKNEKAAHEEAKRKEINERLLEEASAPAYEREIEDCGTLIDYFSRGKGAPAPTLSSVPVSASTPINALASVPAFDIRKVDTALPEGAVALKKKGQQEEEFFVGGGGKKKKNQRSKATSAASNAPEADGEDSAASQSLNLPMSTLAGLLALEIAAPLSSNDVPRTIEALKEKQKWMQENQSRVTKERIAKAQARIDRAGKEVPLQGGPKVPKIDTNTDGANGDEPNGYREEADIPISAKEKVTGPAAEVDGEVTADAEEPTLANGDAEPVTKAELAAAQNADDS